MDAKEIMSKFDELYGIMATSTNVKYMRTFGDTMRCMMQDMASKHPELAQEYIEKLCAIKWKNYLTKKEASEIVSDHGCTVAKILGKESVKDIDGDNLVNYGYNLALDLLKDKDGVYDIREYFLKRTN